MLESLFGSISKERVLAYLFSNEEGVCAWHRSIL